jgi:toxin YoeB
MEIIYSDEAKRDIEYWKKSGNKAIQNKIQELLKVIEENPFVGIGKPEPLKHNLTGLWSRRINQEHRLIYRVHQNKENYRVYSIKGHYD